MVSLPAYASALTEGVAATRNAGVKNHGSDRGCATLFTRQGDDAKSVLAEEENGVDVGAGTARRKNGLLASFARSASVSKRLKERGADVADVFHGADFAREDLLLGVFFHRDEAGHVADIGVQIRMTNGDKALGNRRRVEIGRRAHNLGDRLCQLPFKATAHAALQIDVQGLVDAAALRRNHAAGGPAVVNVGTGKHLADGNALQHDGALFAKHVSEFVENGVFVGVLDDVSQFNPVAILLNGAEHIPEFRLAGFRCHAFNQHFGLAGNVLIAAELDGSCGVLGQRLGMPKAGYTEQGLGPLEKLFRHVTSSAVRDVAGGSNRHS